MARWSKRKQELLRRAVTLIKARRVDDVPDRRRGEARVIRETTGWYTAKGNVCGVAIGYRFEGTRRTARPAVQVFIQKKDPKLARRSKRRVRGFMLHGQTIETQVIECRESCLDVGVGVLDRIGKGQNPGTIGALLEDEAGNVYAVSAAHVLCESFDTNTPVGKKDVLVRGDSVFAFDSVGRQLSVRLGQVFDRRLFDFGNRYRLQNVDVAIAMLLPSVAARVDRTAIPYRREGRPRIGDDVRVLGATTAGAGRAGKVIASHYAVEHNRFKYADESGALRPLRMEELFLAEYQSDGGDSGGAVIRDADSAIVGIHIGRELTDKGEFGVFFDIGRALGSWPFLKLVTS